MHILALSFTAKSTLRVEEIAHVGFDEDDAIVRREEP